MNLACPLLHSFFRRGARGWAPQATQPQGPMWLSSAQLAQLPLPVCWPAASLLLPLPPSHPAWLQPAGPQHLQGWGGGGLFLIELPRALDTILTGAPVLLLGHCLQHGQEGLKVPHLRTPLVSPGVPRTRSTSPSLGIWPSPQHVPTPAAQPPPFLVGSTLHYNAMQQTSFPYLRPNATSMFCLPPS